MGRALITLQRAFGLIPRILGKGDAARRLTNIMFRLRTELPSSSTFPGINGYGQIDSLIVLDRQVDMITPLCTQLTYEGLIDETIGIKNCFVEVDPALTNPAPPTPSSSAAPHSGAQGAPPRKKKHLLSTLGTSSSSTAGSASAKNSAIGQQQQPAAPGGDPLFSDLRDRNFTVIGGILNRIAKRINTDYEGRHSAQTVGQIREFVGKLSGLQAEHQALRLHTGLTEQIMSTTGTAEFNRVLEIQQSESPVQTKSILGLNCFHSFSDIVAGLDLAVQETAIRELINQAADLSSILRLLCLYSLISGGIKPKALEEFKREILQTYGYQYLPLLISLADLNLLSRFTGTKSAFTNARKPLKLVVDEVDEGQPEDISYVYSGYAPISVRMVQHAIGLGNSSGGMVGGLGSGGAGARERTGAQVVGWKSIDEVMRTLPGAVFEEHQHLEDAAKPGKAYHQDNLPVTVVCFIGGCTYTEIAALRFTSQRLRRRKFLIVTTGILNGNTIMDALGPPTVENKP